MATKPRERLLQANMKYSARVDILNDVKDGTIRFKFDVGYDQKNRKHTFCGEPITRRRLFDIFALFAADGGEDE